MYSCGPLHTNEQRLADQLEPIYNNSVLIQDRWTIEMGGMRGPGRSVLAAWHDDDTFKTGPLDDTLGIGKKKKILDQVNREVALIRRSSFRPRTTGYSERWELMYCCGEAAIIRHATILVSYHALSEDNSLVSLFNGISTLAGDLMSKISL